MAKQIDGVKKDSGPVAVKTAAKKENKSKSTAAANTGNKKDSPKNKGSKGGFLVLAVLAILAVAVVYVWQNADKAELKKDLEQSIQNKEKEFNLKLNEYQQDVQELKQEKEELEMEKAELEDSLDTVRSGAKMDYSQAELGLTFEYPAAFGQANYEESEAVGGTGTLFRVTFSDNPNLIMGGISEDFSAGREGQFIDSQGYLEKNGKYFFEFVSSKPDDSYPLEPVKVLDASGEEILIVDKNSFVSERGGVEGPLLNPGDNSLGALLNLKTGDFPGMAIWNKDASSTPLPEFEEMLKTIQIK